MATNYFPEMNFQPPDPLGQAAKTAQLSNMLQTAQFQRQMQPLQLQQEQNTVKQQQMAFDSQQAIMDAYLHSGGDLDKATQLAADSGKALPSDVFALQQHALQVKQLYSSYNKEQLGLIETQNNNLRGLFDPVISADSAKQPHSGRQARRRFSPIRRPA